MQTMSNNKAATLWMGDLEPYMDEPFIKQAFTTMGEIIIYVKIMRNRYTGQPFGYGFVEFESEDVALRVLHRVNGKMIPSSSPTYNREYMVLFKTIWEPSRGDTVYYITDQKGMDSAGDFPREGAQNVLNSVHPKRFKLNHANHGHPYNKEFSLFIGDLSPEVDDLSLYKAFSSWYPSCKVARVVLDNTGRSRGYGFVRFSEESEQRHALLQMQNYSALGSKPIRVSLATPKNRPPPEMSAMAPAGDYGQYSYQSSYDQYQNYYQGWPDYSQYYATYGASGATAYAGYAAADASQQDPQQAYQVAGAYETQTADNSVEEHEAPVDINQLNQAYLDKCDEVFEELDASRWAPSEVFEFASVEVK